MIQKNKYDVQRYLRPGKNLITVYGCPPMLYMTLHLSRPLSISQFIEQFVKESKQTPENSKAEFLELIKAGDDLDVEESFQFSLLDPLSKLRMTFPVRSVHCDHLPCFDLQTFLEIYLEKEKKMCPVCNQQIFMGDIKLDRYVMSILANTGEDDDEVNMTSSGTWDKCAGKSMISEEEEEEEQPEFNLDEQKVLDVVGVLK